MNEKKLRFLASLDRSIAAALTAHELSMLAWAEEDNQPILTDRQSSPAWFTVNLKEYPRLEKIQLPRAEDTRPIDIADVLSKRHSVREFDLGYVSIRDLGAVFDLAARTPEINNPYHRPYPSAGARYPVEIYLISIRIEDIPPGVYHYDSHKHSLTTLLERDFSTGWEEIVGDHGMTAPALVLILTAVFHRSMIKYEGRGYRYALFEAGAIAQTIDLVSRERGLAAVWLGGFPDHEVAKLLDLNWEMEMEAPVLLLAIGRG